jgi:xylose isomerase
LIGYSTDYRRAAVIKYVGADSTNPPDFRHCNEGETAEGKTMKDPFPEISCAMGRGSRAIVNL